MMRSLFSAVSGLKTHQTKMDVIGNNVSNVNTVAFKGTSVTFNEIMYQNLSGASGANGTTGKGGVNAKQVGLGVTMGATNINITAPGAAETTGRGFDLRLTDTNSTNFFIVNNGTENLFTRAGSFYVDGAGNLAMTSTGYTVMGWQVDPTTGNIKKDAVSALRVMQEKNLTANPESTTNGVVGGILDKNDSNMNSDGGYTMLFNFVDNLGYSYTAKFAVKVVDADEETYTVELTDIMDSNDHSVLSDYLASKPDASIADIFGKRTTSTQKYDIKDANVKYTATNILASDGTVSVPAGSYYKTFVTHNGSGDPITGYALVTMETNPAAVADPANNVLGFGDYRIAGYTIDNEDGTTTPVAASDGKITDLFGISQTQLNYLGAAATDPIQAVIANGQFQITGPAINNTLKFDKNTGIFSYVGDVGQETADFKLADTLGNHFSDISLDFTQCKSADNGHKATLGMDPGALDGSSGTGKKLGALKELQVDNYGKIYATYSNGNTVLVGQLAVARFANASGLEKVGDNCYTTTLNSGDFDGVGEEIAADGSSMTSGELEMSNVDLASEFTQMIVTQRGYQANSRVITTSDSLLEELINLKR